LRWAILPHSDKALVSLVERSGWRQVASDRVGAIYVRPPSA
jgi:hypothetical protein